MAENQNHWRSVLVLYVFFGPAAWLVGSLAKKI
jgi:hypothetical protein